MNTAVKWRDLAVIFLFLLLALLAFLFFRGGEPEYLVVEIEGIVVERIAISEISDHTTRIYQGALGELTVSFDSGKVSVLKSDCPSGQCVHTGEITSAGQCIVCLPNRFSIYFEGGSVDGVTG